MGGVALFLAPSNRAPFLEPDFLFKYYGFSWVQPWPGQWLYVHWAVFGVLAFFIAIGFCYRASVILFCLGWTYSFLLDEQQYVNHFYLACLFSFLLIFIPAHGAFSVDAWLRPGVRRQTASAWTLWLLRFQMAVVYFFAGIAKISPDWIRGEPMWAMLAESEQAPAIHRFLIRPWVVSFFSWSALLFDLCIVPFLLWRRTRIAAFCLALAFHLMNEQLFWIEFFPFLAIVATTLFLSPGWPRRLLSFLPQPKSSGAGHESGAFTADPSIAHFAFACDLYGRADSRAVTPFSLSGWSRMVLFGTSFQLADADSAKSCARFFLRGRSQHG